VLLLNTAEYHHYRGLKWRESISDATCMDWPRSFLASSLWFGMTLTPGNRSARLVTFLTERSSYTLRLLSRSLAAWRFNGPEPRESALSLGFIYLVFALLWVPHIVAEPRVFDRWGNFFEQFSLVSGALIVYASPNPRVRNNRQHWLGSDTYSSESVLFPSRSNSSFIFLEPPPSFPNGFLRAKCSGRSSPRLRLCSRPSLYFPGVRPF